MPLSVAWSQNIARQFMDNVRGYLLATPSLRTYFEGNGLVKQVPKGQDRFTYLTVSEPKGGQLTTNIHDYYVNAPEWKETSVGMVYLVAKIILSKQDVDKHMSGHWLRGDLIQDTINLVMPKMLNQEDAFLAWGDEYKHSPDELEVLRAAGAYTGIFNGGTAIGGGIGEDNNMAAAGDYLYTVENMRKALRTAKHELDKYMILSDLNTEIQATINNHFYSTIGQNEKQRVRELNWIKDWISSTNFIDYSAVKYRMAMLAPNQTNKPIGARDTNNNFELWRGYNYEVHADANGGTIDNYYVWYIITSFRLVEYYSTAIQRTGTLAFT